MNFISAYFAYILTIILLANSFSFADGAFDKMIKDKKYKEAIEYAEDNIPPDQRTAETWVAIADAHSHNKKYVKALACYMVAYRMNPDDEKAMLGTSVIYNQMKQHENAYNMSKKLLIKSTSFEANWEFAKACIALNRSDEAKTSLEKVLAENPKNLQAGKELGMVYYREKNYEKAGTYLVRVYKKKPDTKLALTIGKVYIELGKNNKSMEYIQEALKKNPQLSEASLLLARMRYTNKEYNKALVKYEKALGKTKFTGSDFYYMAVSYEKEGNKKKSLKTYTAALEKFGDSSDKEAILAHYKVASFHSESKEIAAALPHLEFVFNKDSKRKIVPAIDSVLGHAYLSIKSYDKAIACFENIIAKDKNNIAAYLSLADLFNKTKMPKIAKMNYEKILTLSPTHFQANSELGALHYKEKNYPRAIALLTKAFRGKKDYAIAVMIGKAYARNKKYSKAIYYFKEAQTVYPESAELNLLLGKAYSLNGNYSNAVDEYNKAAGKQEFNGFDYYYEAVALENSNAKKKAIASYQLAAQKFEKSSIPQAVKANAAIARNYLDNKDFANALKYLKLVQSAGKNSAAISGLYLLLSDAYAGIKDITNAIGYLEKELKKNNRNIEALARLAALHEKTGKKNKAKKIYEKIIAIDKNDNKPYLILGEINLKEKKYKKALGFFEKSYKLKSTLKASEGAALCASKLDDWEKAVDAAENALIIDEKSFAARSVIARHFIIKKNYTQAAALYESLLKDDSENIHSLEQLALCYEKTGNRKKLSEIDEKIIAIDKNNISPRLRLGMFHLQEKDTVKAMNVYQELYALSPDHPDVLKNLCRIHLSKGGKDSTLFYLAKYLKISPNDAWAHRVYGDIYFDKKSTLKALNEYRKAFALNPGIQSFFDNYISLLKNEGKNAELIKVLNQKIKNKKADAATYSNLAELYAAAKSYTQTIAMLQKALQMKPTDFGLLESLAKAYRKSGDIENALLSYEQIIIMKPDNFKTFKMLGELHLEKRDTSFAVKFLEQYLLSEKADNKTAKFLGDYNLSKKQNVKAIKYYGMIQKGSSHYVAGKIKTGEAYYALRNYQKVIKTYEPLAADNYFNNGTVFKLLADAYDKKGNKEAAAKTLNRLAKNPNVSDKDVSYKSGFFLEETKPGKALKIYEKNIIQFPRDYRNYWRAGKLIARSGKNLRQAAMHLKKAVSFTGCPAEAWKDLGAVYSTAKKPEREKAAYKTFLDKNPNNPEANMLMGWAFLKEKGKENDALLYLEIANNLSPKNPDVLFLLGKAHESVNMPEKAIEIYIRAREFGNLNTEIPGRLVELYTKIGKTQKARDEMGNVAEAKKGDTQYRFKYIDILIEEKNYQRALTQLDKLLEKEPSNVMYLKKKALCYNHFSDAENIAALDKKIISLDKKDIPSRERLAEYYMSKSDHDEAFALIKQLHALMPADTKILEQCIKLAKKLNNSKAANLYLNKYIKLQPNNAAAYIKLGNACYQSQDYPAALVAYKKAIKIDPDKIECYQAWSEIALILNKNDEAAKALEGLVRIGKADIHTFLALGNIYKKQNKYKKALSIFKKAANAFTKSVKPLYAVGQCQQDMKRLSEALVTYEQILILRPNDIKPYKNIGAIYHKQTRDDKAAASYKKYLKKYPGDFEAIAPVAQREIKKENYKDALSFLKSAKGKDTKNPQFLLLRGKAYFYSNKYTEAIKDLEKCNALSKKKNAEVTELLSRAYEKVGKKEKALELYKQNMDKNDAEARYKTALLQEKVNPPKAIPLYKKNITAFPKDYRNYLRLAKLYAEDKSLHSKSVTLLKKAVAIANNTIPDVWIELAELYGDLKKYDDQIAAYKKFLETDPLHEEVNIKLGLALVNKGSRKEGLEYLTTANSRSPKNINSIKALAEAYSKLNKHKEAAGMLVKANKIQPEDTGILKALIDEYYYMSKTKDALRELDNLFKIKRDAKSLKIYAELQYRNNNYKKAEDALLEILNSKPNNIEALFLLAKTQKAQGNADLAIETLKEILSLKENAAQALLEIAQLYFKVSDVAKAETYFRKTLTANPKIAAAEFGLAGIAKIKNDKKAYISRLEKAVALDPENKAYKKELKSAQ